MQTIEVKWLNKRYCYPYRIYYKTKRSAVETTNDFESLCLFSRHCNGFIREIAVKKLMKNYPSLCIPFLIQLLAEYVIEICIVIINYIDEDQKDDIKQFLQMNPKYARTVKSQISSYWNCYYRSQYLLLKEYPPHKLLSEH